MMSFRSFLLVLITMSAAVAFTPPQVPTVTNIQSTTTQIPSSIVVDPNPSDVIPPPPQHEK